jgi:hypothetical protein
MADPIDSLNRSKVRRQRMAAYGLLFLLLAIVAVTTATLYEFAPSKGGTFHFTNGELLRGTEVRHLNPLLDLKLRILADYPIEKLNRTRDTNIQQVNDPETLRAVYYNLFLLSDWSEIKRLFATLPGNKSFALQVDSSQIGPIVDILDSTILAAAYLYERLNMNEAATYFYSLYLDCLRPISFSSPGVDDDVLGPRISHHLVLKSDTRNTPVVDYRLPACGIRESSALGFTRLGPDAQAHSRQRSTNPSFPNV